MAVGLALLPLPTIGALLAGGLVVALVLIDPAFGLYVTVLSAPVQKLTLLPGGVSYTQAAVALTAFSWGLRVLAHPERPIVKGRLLPLWVAFLCALLLSASFTPYARGAALKETLRWAEAFFIWLLVINMPRSRRHVAGLIACLLLAPAAEAAFGLIQSLSGVGPASFGIPGTPYARAYGTLGTPNAFAGYLNMAWPLALALAAACLRAKGAAGGTKLASRVLGVVLAIVALLLLLALLLSFSRGAWVGAAAGAMAMALALGRRAARWIAAAGAASLVATLALGWAGLLPAPVSARMTSITSALAPFDVGTVTVTPANFAIVERAAQIQAGWRMFLSHPLVGVGPGNYTAAYSDVTVAPWYVSRGHAHNYYVHIAAEAGIIGALAYLMLIGAVAYQAVVALGKTNRTIWHTTVIGCCGIIAAVAGHNLFENLHVLSMGVQIAAVWGLLFIDGDYACATLSPEAPAS